MRSREHFRVDIAERNNVCASWWWVVHTSVSPSGRVSYPSATRMYFCDEVDDGNNPM